MSLSTMTMPESIEFLAELADIYKKTDECDVEAWMINDPGFDIAFEAALPRMIDQIGGRIRDLLAVLTDAATIVEHDASGHPSLQSAIRKAGQHGYPVEAVEEHQILFLPISGILSDIQAMVTTDEGRDALFAILDDHQMMADGTDLYVCPFTITPGDAMAIQAGRLRRFTQKAAAAFAQTHSDGPAQTAAFAHLASELLITERENEDDTPDHASIGARSLVLYRKRIGLRHVSDASATHIGHDLDFDPLLGEEMDGMAYQACCLDTIMRENPVIVSEPTHLAKARTMMATLHIKIMVDTDLIAQGAELDRPADILHLYRDENAVHVAATFEGFATTPFVVPTAFLARDPDTFLSNVQIVADDVIIHETRAAFETAIRSETSTAAAK